MTAFPSTTSPDTPHHHRPAAHRRRRRPRAWEQIVRRYEPAVAAMIATYRLQEADARDAAQRTWLRMLESHQQIREPEALGGWLKTTARRECLRILAEQRRIDPLPEGTECPDTAVDVERSVVDADQARHLRGLLTTLPARSFALDQLPVPGRPARVRRSSRPPPASRWAASGRRGRGRCASCGGWSRKGQGVAA